MSLKTKIVLVVSVVITLYAGVAYVVQRLIVFPTFIALEQERAKRNMERGTEGLEREINRLEGLAREWAMRDGTYSDVTHRDMASARPRPTATTLAQMKLNLLYLVDSRGRVMWGEVRDADTASRISLRDFPVDVFPASHPVLRGRDGTRAVAGVLMTERGPLLIAAHPLLTGMRVGWGRRTVILGRFLTRQLVQTIARQALIRMEVWPIQGNALPRTERYIAQRVELNNRYLIQDHGSDTLRVYTTITDLRGVPVLLLRVEAPMEITARGLVAIKVAQSSTLIIGVTLLLVLMLSLQMIVIGPLSQLTAHAISVGDSGDLSSRVSMKRNDEIGVLANEFDRMVHQLYEARRTLMDQTFRSGMAEMAAGVLHNVRNAISPLIARIDTMIQSLKRAPIEQIERARAELTSGNPSAERAEDLVQYLNLAHQGLFALVKEMGEKLQNVMVRTEQIEQMLVEQDKVSHAERPVELFSLEEMMRDSIRAMRDNLRSTISIEIDPTVAGVGPVKSHRISVMQVFLNILTNAAEAIRTAGTNRGVARVRARVTEEDGVEMVHVQICDNGPGIAAENLERIFQRGFSTKPHSAGLGLHWSANAVNSINGRIYAESEGLGNGACISVIVPRNVSNTRVRHKGAPS